MNAKQARELKIILEVEAFAQWIGKVEDHYEARVDGKVVKFRRLFDVERWIAFCKRLKDNPEVWGAGAECL